MGNNKGFIISHITFVSDLEFTKIMCTTSCFGALSPFVPIVILEGSNSRGGPTFSRDFGKVLVLRCKLYDFLQHGNVCKLCFTTTCANLSLFTNIDRGSPLTLGLSLGVLKINVVIQENLKCISKELNVLVAINFIDLVH